MKVNDNNEVTSQTNAAHGTRAALGLAALGFVLFVAVVQFGREVILSLKAYSMAKGIFGSQWVGMENYLSFFENPNGVKVIINTLVYNLLFAGFCFLIAILGGWIVNSLSKRSILRDTLSVLAILPVFIPSDVYAAWFMNLLGSLPFSNAAIARFLIPLITSLKYAGIPVMVSHILGILKRNQDTFLPIKCAGLFSLAALSLAGVGHFSLMKQFQNPLIFESADILDTYSFRTGFMQMNFGVHSAAGVLQVFICIAFMTLLFIPMKILFKAIFEGEKEYTERPLPGSIPSAAFALAAFVLLYLLPYILGGRLSNFSGFKIMKSGDSGSSASLLEGAAFVISPAVTTQWVIISIAAALLCTVIAFAAGSFASGGKAVRKCGVILLTVITLLSVRPFTISGYMSLKSLGMVNTYMSIIMASMFSAAAVWAFAAIQGDEHMRSMRKLLFGAIGIFLIQMALIYSDGTPAILYLNKPGLSPLLMYNQLAAAMQAIQDYETRLAFTGALGVSGLILSLPPLLAFLLAKILLPAEAMLAAIAGGKKH
jgi:ABC-type polysaccharide transport system permease subunit